MSEHEVRISRAETDKINRLTAAAMVLSPHEVRKLIGKQGISIFPAPALALACRYRGLDMVKALTEGGAFLGYDREEIMRIGQSSAADFRIPYNGSLCASLLDKAVLRDIESLKRYNIEGRHCLPLLSRAERLGILEYLLENAERVKLETEKLLFIAYMQNEREFISALKKAGCKLSDRIVGMFTRESSDYGRFGDINANDLRLLTEHLSDDELVPVITNIVREIADSSERGKPIAFDMGIWDSRFRERSRFEDPALFRLLTEEFAVSEKDRKRYLKRVVFKQNISCMELAAKAGWLSDPVQRDAMIAFAQKYEKPESIAWLLDFKSRNFDLEAEREAAEKLIEEELNAAPDSPLIMGRLWKWDTFKDGNARVTYYLGEAAEVYVPPVIDSAAVKAVGNYAFSPNSKCGSVKRKAARRAITEVHIPETVTKIEQGAFCGCVSLEKINIPPSVRVLPYRVLCSAGLRSFTIEGHVRIIGKEAFANCGSLETVVMREGVEVIRRDAFAECYALETAQLPRSVGLIENGAFGGCGKLTAKLYEGSYAEEYCKLHDIPYVYIEE